MKKLVVLLLLLLWPAVAARGESWTVDTPYNPIYYVETFGNALPEMAKAALAGTPFAEDKAVRGVMVTEQYKDTQQMNRRFLLLAAEHQSVTMLIEGLELPESGWQVWAATETFLRGDESFAISARPRYDNQGRVMMVWPTVEYGQEVFYIGGYEGYSYVYAYENLDEQGNGIRVMSGFPGYSYEYSRMEQGVVAGETTYFCAEKPARLDLLDADDFPCNLEKLAMGAEAWERIEANLDTYYAQGANLREKPTGKSRSLGVYRGAVAEKLDAAPGTQHPWYKLRIGDTVGWMSGKYVICGEKMMTPPAVARCNADTSLYLSPGDQVKQTLPAGTAVHIIADCDGWYHVVLPREDITWKLDGQGTYGYVRMTDVTEYTTLLNMKHGVIY